MKVRIACISLALSFVAAHTPAMAADWNDGGGSLKDMSPSPAVAVPAPVPIPIMRAAWYFRLDAGVGKINEPDISEEGFEYGQGALDETDQVMGPLYMNSDWFSSDFDTLTTFGGGVGYNFGRIRLDATVEKRSKDDIQIEGDQEWRETAGAVNPDHSIHVHEEAKIDGTLWMLNGYWDILQNRGFTPYIGAGIGFAWNQVQRIHESTVVGCGTCVTVREGDGEEANKVTLAAAIMAGLSYDVTEITTIDLGYRYLFIDGTDTELLINNEPSRLSIGDQHVHQFRAGLRFNVN